MEKVGLVNLKKDINLLRSNLNELSLAKREKLKEIQKIKTDIRAILSKVNEFKNKKDSFSDEINELKKQRDIHNTNVKNLVSSLKELNSQSAETEKKLKVRINPLALREKIDKMEEKIETEVISFEKEKKIMAEMKKLRAEFKNSGELFAVREKIEKLSRNVKEEREKGNSFHNKIMDIFSSNKEKNRGFKDLFKNLDKLRKDQEDRQKEIDEINKKFDAVNSELNPKLTEIGKLNEEKKQREEKLLEEKSKIVEEKIKNRGKLTTQDLLVMQSTLKDED